MENNNNSQIVKFDRTSLLDIISKADLSVSDKQELTRQILSDERAVVMKAVQQLNQSVQAHDDIDKILNQLSDLNKQGMYTTTKMHFETGSGKIEMQFKGGDTKLIIPVLVIIGIVLIAALIIMFWH